MSRINLIVHLGGLLMISLAIADSVADKNWIAAIMGVTAIGWWVSSFFNALRAGR